MGAAFRAIYQRLNIVITPPTGSMTTEFYLKARPAGAETLDQTL